jgi:hypothetical protein
VGVTVAFWDTAFHFFWREESLLVFLMTLGLVFLLLHFHKYPGFFHGLSARAIFERPDTCHAI